MDATALTVVGTGVALFVALWKVQGNRFDAVDKRFDMAEKLNRERFEMAETQNRERFEMAEKLNRERFDMAETQNRERFEAMDRRWTERFDMAENANRERFETAESANRERFEMGEKQNQAAHAAICESIARLDERTRADTAALHQRFDALNGRFDDLYRHLLGAAAKTGLSGPAAAAG